MDEHNFWKRFKELKMDTPRAHKVLPDGREVTVIERIFNTIVTIGPAGAFCYDQHW